MKEYNLDHLELTSLHDILHAINWERLLVPSKAINRTLVNEFYACVYDALKDTEKFDDLSESVQVRVIEVDFEPDT